MQTSPSFRFFISSWISLDRLISHHLPMFNRLFLMFHVTMAILIVAISHRTRNEKIGVCPLLFCFIVDCYAWDVAPCLSMRLNGWQMYCWLQKLLTSKTSFSNFGTSFRLWLYAARYEKSIIYVFASMVIFWCSIELNCHAFTMKTEEKHKSKFERRTSNSHLIAKSPPKNGCPPAAGVQKSFESSVRSLTSWTHLHLLSPPFAFEIVLLVSYVYFLRCRWLGDDVGGHGGIVRKSVG